MLLGMRWGDVLGQGAVVSLLLPLFLYLREGRQAWHQGWRLTNAEPIGNYSIKTKASAIKECICA